MIRKHYRTATLVAVGALLVPLAACGNADQGTAQAPTLQAGQTDVGVGAWSGLLGVDLADRDPTVPQVEVTLAQAPYWDHSTEKIGIDKGWFGDAGITIAPKPSGEILDMDQIAPALLSGQIDVGTMVPQIWTSSLDQGVTARVFTSRDIFMGHAFLASPRMQAKSVQQLMAEGMSWDEALKAGMAQLKGQTVYVTDEASPRSFRKVALESAGMSDADYTSNVLDDTTMQQLAIGGRADFVAPASGPNIVTLISKGWVPILSTSDIVEHGAAEQLLTVIVNTGLAAEEKWLQENPETAIRLAGVQYRILDFKKSDPAGAAAIQIPFINSIAGTSFTDADAKTLDERIDPFFTFDEQTEFFEDTASPVYWSKPIDATIASLKADGLVTGEHQASDVSWADATWLTLKGLRDKAATEIEGLEAESSLSEKSTTQLQQAKAFLEARNYLDAYRFANAAQLNK